MMPTAYQEHGGEPIIPFSAAFENKINDMPEDEKDKYCKEKGVVCQLPKVSLEAAALGVLS
jgi:obg-like ATPase 1